MAENRQVSGGAADAAADGRVIWQDRKHFMWFPISFTKYCVRRGRIFVDRGFFNSVQDQTLLYRIIDIQLRRSLAQKLFGTGTVALITKADINHEILLKNIKNPGKVNDLLSDLIEEARHQKNVVGKEFFSSGGPGIPHGAPPVMPHDLDGMDGMDDDLAGLHGMDDGPNDGD